MPDSTAESASAAAANHNDDAGDAVAGVSGEQNKRRHNSGAADLEKVTDYAEEKEILSTSTDLDDAIAVIRRLSFTYLVSHLRLPIPYFLFRPKPYFLFKVHL